MPSGSIHQQRFHSVNLRRGAFPVVYRYCLLAVSLGLGTIPVSPAPAQNANQPAYDPRQTEKRFEDQESSQATKRRPRLPLPPFVRPEASGNSKPLFVLQRV